MTVVAFNKSIADCLAVYSHHCKAHTADLSQVAEYETSLVGSDILMWAQVMVVSTLGYCLLFAIIHFERFGGDTQKRSLGNRLSSFGAVNVCLQITFRSTIIIFIR